MTKFFEKKLYKKHFKKIFVSKNFDPKIFLIESHLKSFRYLRTNFVEKIFFIIFLQLLNLQIKIPSDHTHSKTANF
jgi:hypothetical protein